MTDTTYPPDDRLNGPIHGWFGLTYSNYQVLPRTLMQSMPIEWQQRAVALFEELRAAFEHIEHPQAYDVRAAREREYGDLSDDELKAIGATREEKPHHDDGFEEEPDEVDVRFYDRDGDEHDGWERALVPCADPIPHYNRGRTYVAPLLEGANQ